MSSRRPAKRCRYSSEKEEGQISEDLRYKINKHKDKYRDQKTRSDDLVHVPASSAYNRGRDYYDDDYDKGQIRGDVEYKTSNKHKDKYRDRKTRSDDLVDVPASSAYNRGRDYYDDDSNGQIRGDVEYKTNKHKDKYKERDQRTRRNDVTGPPPPAYHDGRDHDNYKGQYYYYSSRSRSKDREDVSEVIDLVPSPTSTLDTRSANPTSDTGDAIPTPGTGDTISALETGDANPTFDTTGDATLSPTYIGDEEYYIPYFPSFEGCRSVNEFECMNRIEEGTYGVVYRAKCKVTNQIVALKRLKMEKEREGFPITSLREINTLLKSSHENIVGVKEIVVGSNMDKIFIVMEYVEHDLKSLMESMRHPFLIGEVKTLLKQLLSAIAHLHDNWILHRDLKTSNLLLNHQGILKVGDFGLAREYGSPLKPYTPVVVTLWYRAPELLLQTEKSVTKYSTPIDVWSIGCIFAEFVTMKPLFPGKSEKDQVDMIFKTLGTPNDKIWPGYSDIELVKQLSTWPKIPFNSIHEKFSNKASGTKLSQSGLDLLNRFLAYCPEKRISASKALDHPFFEESPKPVDPSMFPSWPAKSEGGLNSSGVKRVHHSPKAPGGGGHADSMAGDNDEVLMEGFHLKRGQSPGRVAKGGGFSLKF